MKEGSVKMVDSRRREAEIEDKATGTNSIALTSDSETRNSELIVVRD